jgi:hypothetical protein
MSKLLNMLTRQALPEYIHPLLTALGGWWRSIKVKIEWR